MQSKDRVKSAVKNSGFNFPVRRITNNLATDDIRKDGAVFNLPMAVGLLVAPSLIPAERSAHLLLKDEISLGGSIKPVRGVLPMAVDDGLYM